MSGGQKKGPSICVETADVSVVAGGQRRAEQEASSTCSAAYYRHHCPPTLTKRTARKDRDKHSDSACSRPLFPTLAAQFVLETPRSPSARHPTALRHSTNVPVFPPTHLAARLFPASLKRLRKHEYIPQASPTRRADLSPSSPNVKFSRCSRRWQTRSPTRQTSHL